MATRKTLAELEQLYGSIDDALFENDRKGMFDFLSGRTDRLVLQLATICGPVAVAWSASRQQSTTAMAAILYVGLAAAVIGIGVYFDRKYPGEKNCENSNDDGDNVP